MKDCKTLQELKEHLPLFLTDLEPIEGKEIYNLKVRVENYVDMMHIAKNLIKLCALATHPEGQELSDMVIPKNIDINRILELTLQFMPESIDELADEIKDLIKSNKKIISCFPLYY